MLRKRYTFVGTIQGVGFRPTVFRCAVSLKLAGFVQNRRSEVVAEVQGKKDDVEAFPIRLKELLPGAASIDSIRMDDLKTKAEKLFRIIPSRSGNFSFPPIPPDLALCDDCRRELLDPADRRYLYPFITCTQCGPRYSIVMDTPFDRENTSMSDFTQCPECAGEYGDPEDRRFHSQTNSCSRCGPELKLIDAGGRFITGDPVVESIKALKTGKIVALMGLGGFHLALDPKFTESVKKLRSDKERVRKPFALMVRDLEEARALCIMGEDERLELTSALSPIYILPAGRENPDYLESVSDTETLGVMLPYTPLHLLLFFHPEEDIPYRHLIMTSGNRREEPVITDPAAALKSLRGIADLFLIHNRRIVFRTDDSIIRRGHKSGSCQLRRSRGFVPRIIRLHKPLEKSTLAVGGDLKNAPAFGLHKDIYLAPYIGDLEDPMTRNDFEKQVKAILALYNIRPEAAVCDLHPGYYSTRWAENRWAESGFPKLMKVQHHHAHLLSVMAEHNLDEVIGLAFDGTGYGTDGAIWGGEYLWVNRSTFRRLGSFGEFLLPGGEAAIRRPIRIAFSLLRQLMEESGALRENFSEFLTPRDMLLLGEMMEKGLNCPVTSSLGRIFDAAGALLGLVDTTSYEGEGPIRLEGLARVEYERREKRGRGSHSKFFEDLIPLEPAPENEASADRSDFYLNAAPLFAYLAENRKKKDTADLALIFHRAAASASFRGALKMREMTGVGRIALSGGVFQNILLRELLVPELEEAGFEVYLNRSIPPGDGGLAVGQAYFVPG